MEQTTLKTKVIGAHINPDITRIGIVDSRANILAETQFSTTDYPDISDYVDKFCSVVTEFLVDNNCFEDIRSIGISCSNANFKTECIENANNLPWKGIVPITSMLRDRLGIAVAIGNNCHAASLAEAHYGCAHGVNEFIYLNIGFGVGGYMFVRGKEHLGANGFAGEIGHTCVKDGGRQCECGLRGCLETYVSVKGIQKTAHEIMDESDKPSLMRNAEKLSPDVLVDFCERGDELAIETFRRTGYILGMGLATFSTMFDPELIIIGGILSKAGHWLIDPACESYDKHVFRNIKNKVKLVISTMPNGEREIIGASALAWQVKAYSLFI